MRDALERNAPAEHILARRKLFSFVQPPAGKRQDGRNGEIDSEVCDPIGQMCALGLLDGHGYDPVELRDKGRFWGGQYAKRFKNVGVKTGGYEHASRTTNAYDGMTGEDLLFDRMDEGLPRYEREVLLTLVVDPLIGHEETVPWAKSLIDEALISRGRIPPFVAFPTCMDREYLKAAIRGLCCLCEGALPGRYERRAA